METIGQVTDLRTGPGPEILAASDIQRRPWRPVAGCGGVRIKELSRSSGCVHALIMVEPGSATPGKPHRGACHHIWVLSGDAQVAGRPAGAGSYVYVPAGAAHPIAAAGATPCVVLQAHHLLQAHHIVGGELPSWTWDGR